MKKKIFLLAAFCVIAISSFASRAAAAIDGGGASANNGYNVQVTLNTGGSYCADHDSPSRIAPQTEQAYSAPEQVKHSATNAYGDDNQT